MSREKTKTEIKYLLYGGYFYGEVAEIRDIVIYARHALKTKNKILYKPDKYENKIILFTENFEAKDKGMVWTLAEKA